MRKKKRDQLAASEDVSMIGQNLNFAASEAYKRLRTNLMFSFPDSDGQKCHIIGITSSVRGEGKSTTSMNLAYTLSQNNKRVLLLEMDLRLPNIARCLNISPTPGLSNLLAGLNRGSEVVQRSGLHPNLSVIVAGDIPPNPSELLGSEQMRITLEWLSKSFDFIICDLPPITAVADALIVSKLVYGMVVAVRCNYSSRRDLADSMRQLELANARILGFVMTHTEDGGKKYNREYEKYGNYTRTPSSERKDPKSN